MGFWVVASAVDLEKRKTVPKFAILSFLFWRESRSLQFCYNRLFHQQLTA
jgi:hypothetical protein